MNKKIKIFYIIDVLIMIISIIGMVILENKANYGLAALTSVGYSVVLFLIFILSIVLIIIVSFIYFLIKLKKNLKE